MNGPVGGVDFKLIGTEPARPTAGTVSLNRLMHPVPHAARKEFERAGKSAEKGANHEAIQHLRKALAIYPDYAEAHNDLGVGYLRQAAYAEAVAEFQAAIALDSSAARPLGNLAIAWVALRRYRDAEFTARRAISLDPGFASAKRALDLAIARVIILPNPPKTQSPPEPRMEASSLTVQQGR